MHILRHWRGYASKSYLSSEQAVYIDELEQELEKEAYRAKYDEQTDPLTGVLNKTYFIRRMKELAKQRSSTNRCHLCEHQ